MLALLTVIVLLLSISPSMVILAKDKDTEVTVNYYLDQYRQNPVVEIILSSDDYYDHYYSVNVGVINGSELEQEYYKEDRRYRGRACLVFNLENFSGNTRQLVVIVKTEDEVEPLKQLAFEIYNFPGKDEVISVDNYRFVNKYHLSANYNRKTLEISKETVDFSSFLDHGNLISDNRIDFDRWHYDYFFEGQTGLKVFKKTKVCFSKGFEGSYLEYTENEGYCFELSYKTKEGSKAGFALENVYYDEETGKYHSSNENGKCTKVNELVVNQLDEEIKVTVDILGQGVNEINYHYEFYYMPVKLPDPKYELIGVDCSVHRFCVRQENEPLPLSNYRIYKVGE